MEASGTSTNMAIFGCLYPIKSYSIISAGGAK
jgi:hypothetical protein